MNCLVEIVTFDEPRIVLVTQGEFDETINAFGETNIVEICRSGMPGNEDEGGGGDV